MAGSSEQSASDTEQSDRAVYRLTHMAFKSEFVIASSEEQAREATRGGYDSGEFTQGSPDYPEKVCEIGELAELDGVGGITVQRLLEADGPLSLGPRGELPLRQRDHTRLTNAVEDAVLNS